MVAPLRPFLLNAQIKNEARRIAHQATITCNQRHDALIPNENAHHTKRCNELTREIEELALQIKFSAMQPPPPRRKEPPPPPDDRGTSIA